MVHKDRKSKLRLLKEWLGLLITPQGDRAGQPFELLSWEERFLRGVMADGVSMAALTIGRGNGKTTFNAALAAAAMAGPLAQPAAEVTLVASSFGQAKIAFAHTRAFLRPWLEREPRRYSIADNSQRGRSPTATPA